MTTTSPLLSTLTRTRLRVLGSAVLTQLAARPGLTGSARAHTAKESTMTTAGTARSTTQETAPADVRPFRVDVPEEDLIDLRQRITATRWPEKETVDDFSQGVPLATMQKLAHY